MNQSHSPPITIAPGEYAFNERKPYDSPVITTGTSKLASIGIDFPEIFDFALDAMQYRFRDQRSDAISEDAKRTPYHYVMHLHNVTKELRDVTSDKIQTTYNEVLKDWGNLKNPVTPLNLLDQLDAKYFGNGNEADAKSGPSNDSGLETGLVSNAFFANANTNMRFLLVNPPSSFLRYLAQNKVLLALNIALAFTYEPYANLVAMHQWPSNIAVQCFEKINLSRSRDRICIFGAAEDYETTDTVLKGIMDAAGTKAHTSIYLVAPTAYLDRRNAGDSIREIINQRCNLLQLLLIDPAVVNIEPKKRALAIFHRGEATYESFRVSKVTKISAKKLLVGDPVEVPYSKLLEKRLTLDGMYKEILAESKNASPKNAPEKVDFSLGISLWYTVEYPTSDVHKCRGRFSFWSDSTEKQAGSKKYDRGKCLVKRIPGSLVDSEDKVCECLDNLLLRDGAEKKPNALAVAIREYLEKKFRNNPIDVKSQWYRHIDKLLSVDDQGRKIYPQYSHELCLKLFLGRDWASNPLCSLIIGSCTEEQIENAVAVYAEKEKESKTNIQKILTQLKIIFSFYYDRRVGERNPVNAVLEKIHHRNERKYVQKEKIGAHSLSLAKMQQFIDSLNADNANPAMALLAKHKAYLAISNGEAAALTIGDYIPAEPGYKLALLSISHQMEQTGTDTLEYGDKKSSADKEEARCVITQKWRKRLLPVPPLLDLQLSKMVRRNIALLKAGGLTEEEINLCPLFPSDDDLRIPVKTRRINEYCLLHLKALGIESMEVYDPDDNSDLDLTRYPRDLLQVNWEHHARAEFKLEENLISYVRGRKPDAVVRSNYCDFDHVHILKQLGVKMDKLPALLELPKDSSAWDTKSIPLSSDTVSITPVLTAKRNELVIEFEATQDDVIDISAYFPHGCTVQVEVIPN